MAYLSAGHLVSAGADAGEVLRFTELFGDGAEIDIRTAIEHATRLNWPHLARVVLGASAYLWFLDRLNETVSCANQRRRMTSVLRQPGAFGEIERDYQRSLAIAFSRAWDGAKGGGPVLVASDGQPYSGKHARSTGGGYGPGPNRAA
jgi:hypothetical protein